METHFSCQLFGKSEHHALFSLKTGLWKLSRLSTLQNEWNENGLKEIFLL